MSKDKFVKWILFLVLILNVNTMNAQNNADDLNAQQKSLVTISALTAIGNLENLKTELNTALNAGVTINEVKEVLVQLYAYLWFSKKFKCARNIPERIGRKENKRHYR